MRVLPLRAKLRDPPPFAPAYVTYTSALRDLIEDLRGFMTVADLAAFSGLTWDTVKSIIKRRLEKDYGRPRLRDLKRLSIDEIYLGRRQGFWTLPNRRLSGRDVKSAGGYPSGAGCTWK